MFDNAINIVIKARDDASKVLNGLQGKMEQLQPTFQRLATVGTATFVAIGGGVAYAVKQAGDMQALKKGLEAVAGSSEEASKQFERLREVAKLPGLGLTEAIRGSINLQAAGLSANLAERSLKAFGNALATVGKGKAELDGVTLALQQISAKGKISAEEINQLNERLPQIRIAMQQAFGTADTEKLQKMGIDAQMFIEKITAEFEKLPAVTGGFNNSMENLGDNMKILAVKVGESFLPAIEKIVVAVTPIVEKIAGWVEQHPKLTAGILATALAVAGITAGVGLLGLAIPAIITGFTFITGTLGLVGLAIAGLVLIVTNLIKTWKLLKENSDMVWLGIKLTVKEVINGMVGLVEGWANSWVKAVNIIIGALNKIQVSIPEWVPGIGGKSFGINLPTVNEVSLPRFEHGGIVPGAVGQAVPIMAHGQEMILPASQSRQSNNGNVTITINNPSVRSDADLNAMKEMIEDAFRDVSRVHKLTTV